MVYRRGVLMKTTDDCGREEDEEKPRPMFHGRMLTSSHGEESLQMGEVCLTKPGEVGFARVEHIRRQFSRDVPGGGSRPLASGRGQLEAAFW